MNYRIVGKKIDIALNLLARDYKGFGTGSELSNGVVEWQR